MHLIDHTARDIAFRTVFAITGFGALLALWSHVNDDEFLFKLPRWLGVALTSYTAYLTQSVGLAAAVGFYLVAVWSGHTGHIGTIPRHCILDTALLLSTGGLVYTFGTFCCFGHC